MSRALAILWASCRSNTNIAPFGVEDNLLVPHPGSPENGVGVGSVILEGETPLITTLVQIGVRTPFSTDLAKVYSEHRELFGVCDLPAFACVSGRSTTRVLLAIRLNRTSKRAVGSSAHVAVSRATVDHSRPEVFLRNHSTIEMY